MKLGELKSEAIDIRNERDQLKQKCDELSNNLDKECNMSLNIEGQLHGAIKQRDLLREDISLLKKNQKTREEVIEQLKSENNNLKQSVSDYKNTAEWYVANWQEYKALEHENNTLKSENKALRLQADEYFELWQESVKNQK